MKPKEEVKSADAGLRLQSLVLLSKHEYKIMLF